MLHFASSLHVLSRSLYSASLSTRPSWFRYSANFSTLALLYRTTRFPLGQRISKSAHRRPCILHTAYSWWIPEVTYTDMTFPRVNPFHVHLSCRHTRTPYLNSLSMVDVGRDHNLVIIRLGYTHARANIPLLQLTPPTAPLPQLTPL